MPYVRSVTEAPTIIDQTAAHDGLTRARRKWIALMGFAVLLFTAAYWLGVQTPNGQRVENAALRGADQTDQASLVTATSGLGQITIVSLALMCVVVAVIALVRRQPMLAVVAVAIVFLGQVVTQSLKRFILPRPELVPVVGDYTHNSLPSGHTTIAMTVLFALVLVVPFRLRGLVISFATVYAVAIGGYTITAKWHRLSDVIAAGAVSLFIASAASLWLLHTGRLAVVRSPGSARYLLRTVVTVIAWLVALGLTAIAVVLLASAAITDPLTSDDEYQVFLGAQTGAVASSLWLALLFWWSWRRVEPKRVGEPDVR